MLLVKAKGAGRGQLDILPTSLLLLRALRTSHMIISKHERKSQEIVHDRVIHGHAKRWVLRLYVKGFRIGLLGLASAEW
jgi:hypothetical protein